MRRLIWLPIAGFLLVAGATVAAAAPSLVGNAATELGGHVEGARSFLQEVLDDLVGDGVINQNQSDAIVDAVDARLEEKRAEFEQRRAEMEQSREQIRSFLEDDVITQDELDQLPADHPLRNAESFLDDGQLTRGELRQLCGSGRAGGGSGAAEGGWGHHRALGSIAPPSEIAPPSDGQPDQDTDSQPTS